MLQKPERGLFITGTDTEVGKTYVASIIARSLVKSGRKVGVYKPIASDCIKEEGDVISSDAIALWESAGCPQTLDDVCPQRFEAAIAPHLAAEVAGKKVDEALLRNGIQKWTSKCDIVLVEGAGGLMSPVSDDEYFADLAYDFGYPLVIVVPNILGCINQTMQTLITASTFRDGLDICGIVINDVCASDGDDSVKTNEREIAKRSMVPVLGSISYRGTEFNTDIDWFKLASTNQSLQNQDS